MIRERSDIRGETIKSILTSGMSLPLCYKLCLHVGPQPRLNFSASSSYKENLQPHLDTESVFLWRALLTGAG